jgi:hypothetical protein
MRTLSGAILMLASAVCILGAVVGRTGDAQAAGIGAIVFGALGLYFLCWGAATDGQDPPRSKSTQS